MEENYLTPGRSATAVPGAVTHKKRKIIKWSERGALVFFGEPPG